MANKQLNLELQYKGKVLDYIKHGSGLFKKEWFVGSNKHLLWQVLLPSFPDKHKLITQKGEQQYLNLLPGSKLECTKGGKAMDAAALSAQGLLQGDRLLLQSDMEGTLTLHPEWQIIYRFREPWVTVLTPEQKQIVATYSRRAESTPQEKMGRTMIILFLVLTIVVLTIYDLALKPDRVAAGTMEATLAQMRTAQRVETMEQDFVTSDREADEAARLAAEAAAAEAAAQAAKAGTATGKTGGGATAAGASSLFGVGSFDPNAVVRNPVAITTTREFVAASRGGGGGGGSGPGGGGGGSGFGGGGTGGGMATTFDPNAIVSYQQSEFASASNVGGLKGTTARPTGQVDVRGNISAAEVAVLGKPIAVTSSERAAISRIASRATAITENTIASAPPEVQSDMEALKRAVNSRKSQLTSLYRKTAAVQSSGGSVNIKIYGTGSRIEAVEVIPVSGNLPTSFLNEIKQAVSSWTVSGVSGAFNYSFTMRFS